jgi:hypothetical protein
VLQLKDMNRLALTVIASRASEIAAVMINPLQVSSRVVSIVVSVVVSSGK